MDEHERWWNRFKVQVASIEKFVADARAEDRPEALDAFQDVLDEIRGQLLEDNHISRRTYAGKPLRGTHPLFRPVAATLARRLSRMAHRLEWHGAGLRARLKQR